MSMTYIREAYNVPAYRGVRVRYVGGDTFEGRIISAKDGKLRVASENGLRVFLHPTYMVQYLNEQGQIIDDRSGLVPSRPPDGEFQSYSHWVNNVQVWTCSKTVCFDSLDRPCLVIRDFARADIEKTFPIRFWHPEARR